MFVCCFWSDSVVICDPINVRGGGDLELDEDRAVVREVFGPLDELEALRDILFQIGDFGDICAIFRLHGQVTPGIPRNRR